MARAHLQLLIDALQAINRGVESANLVALDLDLLLEILHLTCVGIALRGVLRLELVLHKVQPPTFYQLRGSRNGYLELSHGLRNIHIADFFVMNGLLCEWIDMAST